MIVGWIRTSIDAKVRSTVTFLPEAHKLWETLRLRFSVKNGTRVHQLQDAITNCRQDGQSVLEYYGRLSKLWEELQNLKTTRPCTCEAATDIEKERQDSRVHKFLFGLDDARFSSIRSRITDEEPLPDINTVYSRVIREEQNMINTQAKEQRADALGFSAKTEPIKPASSSTTESTSYRPRDPNRMCTHCVRKGHEVSECFLLHGFPEWYQEQFQRTTTTSPGQSSQSFRGGRGGHSNGTRGRGRGRASHTTASINNDQIASLIALLQNQQSKSIL